MPVIAPPRNATASASLSPVRAASAVRTFERTEMFMPMYPASPESTAPTTKPPAVAPPSAHQMITNRMTPTIAMVVYCRLRYACAPAWIAAAISRIRSLPVLFFMIQLTDTMP